MKALLRTLLRWLRQLPLALFSPLFVLLAAGALVLCDALWRIMGRRRPHIATRPGATAASVVIPNWNGRDLLEKYLPPLVEAIEPHPGSEIIVVDNASSDGSADFIAAHFPTVRVLQLPRNLGFGGGSNAGVRAAANDIVVLLNSDMRVARDFLAPLLAGFQDDLTFAVSCQIFFSDPARKREETGLTQGRWAHGGLRVRHREDAAVTTLFPCFYGGGGSCAFDRRKFLELGGFDPLYHPFYLEDTDLGYLAWKRGWKVLYQPASRVWHEHRGTIGKKFSREYIDAVVARNFLLFTWKNIHSPARLLGHFFHTWAGALLSMLAGPSPERPSFTALARACFALPRAASSRWRARSLAEVDDSEALLRATPAGFRDRFHTLRADSERLNVLFLSPYPVCPPIHGGGVFMYETLRELGRHTNLHMVALLDFPHQSPPHHVLEGRLSSMEFIVRNEGQPRGVGAITPFSVREFADDELAWALQRQIYNHAIDVLQLDYTNMGQYAGPYRQIVNALFEHDVYFQSIARTMASLPVLARIKGAMEYLRALRYELRLLPQMDEIQTCTKENSDHLLSYLPELRGRLHHNLRAVIDVSSYAFSDRPRKPKTMLFLGGFRHLPNMIALRWLLDRVMPVLLEREPAARLIVIGSDPPPEHTIPTYNGAVELVGFAPDIRQPLDECAVFVCPILSGSGVRVKLLEAFAAGIPTVSTRIGAEGLGTVDGENCALADTPEAFAAAICRLFEDPDAAAAMARRARAYVLEHHDVHAATARLVDVYRETLAEKLGRLTSPSPRRPS